MASSRRTQPTIERPLEGKRLRAPTWIDDELIADTISTWQPYYDTPLTEQDAIEMLVNVGRLIETLEADDAENPTQE